MRVRIRCLLASFGLCLGPLAAAQAPPIEAFASLPAMQSPSLSPDGKRLAFIAQSAAGRFVLVSRLEDMAVTSAINVSAGKPRQVLWTGDDSLVLLTSDTVSPRDVVWRVEATTPFGIDLTGELTTRQLLQDRSLRGGGRGVFGGFRFIQGAQLIGFRRSSDEILFPKFDEDANRVLYAVDPKTDRRRALDSGTRFTRDWVVDENGEPAFRVDYDQQRDRFTVRARRDDQWQIIATDTVAIPELGLQGLSPEGELIVGVRPKDVGRFGLYVMSPADGSIGRPFFTDDTLDVTGARIDPYTNRVIGAEVEGKAPVWFDTELTKQQALVDEAFSGELPRLISWSKDRSRFVLRTNRNDHAPAYYVYDARESTAKQIASTYPALDRTTLAKRLPYTYKARDGVDIPGYLTRPVGATGATPLVVLPHGGPAARDVDGFDWLAHYLASRGYAVLQPNFRGSRGYGQAWEEAGHGQWGVGVMQHDLTDGVGALVSAGIADADRVCIVGGSYGGYAALAGATFTPQLYRCAAAIAGVADLSSMLAVSTGRAGGLSSEVSYWRLAMGASQGSANETLAAASPAEHVDDVRAAVLLIHGRDDTVVSIGQSRTMESALQRAGKTVQFVELEGEDHWLSTVTTRIEALRALDAFLAQHLKN